MKKFIISLIYFLLIYNVHTINAQLPKVALICADYYGGEGTQLLKADLEATGRFESVDFWNAINAVDIGVDPPIQPTLADLLQYDAVLVHSDGNFMNMTALGNDLDAFATQGGGVILAPYVLDLPGGPFAVTLGGAWENGEWDIVLNHELVFLNTDCHEGIGTIYEPGTDLVDGVENLTFSQFNTIFQIDPPVVPEAVRVLDMENGHPILYRHETLTNRLDIGYRATQAQDCNWSGHMDGGANFIANCLEYVSGGNLSIENHLKSEILIYPNPVNEKFYISSNKLIQSVSIINVLGLEVYNTANNLTEVSIDVSTYAKGTYFVKLNVDENIVIKKFIKH